MEIITTAINSLAARRLAVAFEQAKATITSLPFDSAYEKVESADGQTSFIVFFGSDSFPENELVALRRLSLLRPERVKVVAVGSLVDTSRILEVIRSGAADYLDVSSGFATALEAVLERLRHLDAGKQQLGRVFAVVSPVGGSGASFLACNIAAALAEIDGDACLVDLHLRGGDQAQLLNVTPRHSLASLAGKVQHLDVAMLEQSLVDHDSGVRLLASPEPFSDYRQVTADGVQRILRCARERFAYVVADLEDIEHAEQLRTLAVCDRVLVLLRPDYVALSRCKRFLEHLARAKVPNDHVLVVVNRTGQPRELPLDCMVSSLGRELVHAIPNDPAAVCVSYNLGTPLVRSNPESPASQSIKRLAQQLAGKIPMSAATGKSTWRQRLATSVGRLQGYFSDGSVGPSHAVNGENR